MATAQVGPVVRSPLAADVVDAPAEFAEPPVPMVREAAAQKAMKVGMGTGYDRCRDRCWASAPWWPPSWAGSRGRCARSEPEACVTARRGGALSCDGGAQAVAQRRRTHDDVVLLCVGSRRLRQRRWC